MIYYIMLINFLGLFIMKIDKYKAKKHRYRISENMLFFIALIGGSLGIYTGMYMFKHKTLKFKFYFGIPLIIIAQCVLFVIFN